MKFKIKEFREAQGLSQEDLSEKSGVSRTTISALEGDEIKVTTTKTLSAIADALGKKVTDIFFESKV